MSKPILISGIQPTGNLHIGNYFGALKHFVDLQNTGRYECLFFAADLHSLTEDFDPKTKYSQVLDIIINYLAAGLNPEKSILFIQSRIPQHAEMAWILNTLTPFGELRRMTQFKDKSSRQKENVNVGLFDYPVLQAADILLYDAQYVPVGEDQLQHLELTRTLARRFNAKFGKILTEPKPLLTEVPKLMSLNDPLKKMSKSIPEGCLFLGDSEDIIRFKIKHAVTDSQSTIVFEPESRPGLANLIRIYRGFSGLSVKQTEKRFANKGYAAFKKELAEIIVKNLREFQLKKRALTKNTSKTEKILEKGRLKAAKRAEQKMNLIKKAAGLIKK